MEAGRQTVGQSHHQLGGHVGAQQVDVVEDEHPRLRAGRGGRDQAGQRDPDHRRVCAGQRPPHRRVERADPLQREGEVTHQLVRVVVRLVEIHPRERPGVVGGPLAQHGRLAVPGRRGEQHQRHFGGGTGQFPEQPAPADRARPVRRPEVPVPVRGRKPTAGGCVGLILDVLVVRDRLDTAHRTHRLPGSADTRLTPPHRASLDRPRGPVRARSSAGARRRPASSSTWPAPASQRTSWRCTASAPTRSAVDRPRRRVDQHRPALPAAQAAVAPDQLLERGDLVGDGVVRAVDDQVADVRQGVVAAQVGDGVRAERGERVDALDPVGGEQVPARPARAPRARAPVTGP